MSARRGDGNDRKFLSDAARDLHELGLHSPDHDFPQEKPIAQRRRAGRRRTSEPDEIGVMTLTETDGVLRWELGTGLHEERAHPQRMRRRGMRRDAGSSDAIREQFKFERLASSQVGEWLESLDKRLTPPRGLRRLGDAGFALGEVPTKGRILLLVHGTFSNGDNFVTELQATPNGREFMALARRSYDAVLSFDHPTISVDPMLNAIDLSRALASTNAAIDVVAHSRGGLVARSYLELFDRAPQNGRRLVLVGSPLGGTSLAAPPRLRAALDWLSNVSRALSIGAAAIPGGNALFIAAAGILRVIGSFTGLAGSIPLLDAAVAMIPGLCAQSRVGNNAGLKRLQLVGRAPIEYSAIVSNFEPEEIGWKFWRIFNSPVKRAADFGADLVFDGPNDLVVDTASMTYLNDTLAIVGKERVLDFGTTSDVHHLNYFRQRRALDFIAARFQLK